MLIAKKRWLLAAIIFLMIAGFAFNIVRTVSAQTNTADPNVLWGGNLSQSAFQNLLGLGNNDPRITAAKMIRAALGFLGLIALCLILYAGFIWMTSGGSEEKISKAKGILKNAAIGLIIIMASFGIVSFILQQLMGATGGSGSGGGGGGGGGGVSGLGNGVVKSVYPAPFQKDVARNTSIIVTFREPMDPATICENTAGGFCAPGTKIKTSSYTSVRIFRTQDTTIPLVTDVDVTSTDNMTFIFQPAAPAYLGGQNQNIDYSVNLTTDIKKADGSNAFSITGGFTWTFEVNNELDLTPPQILQYDHGGIFPQPDDDPDTVSTTLAATAATGNISVSGQPAVYRAASASIVRTAPPSITTVNAQVSGTNVCAAGTVDIAIISSSGLKAHVVYSQSGLLPADLNIISNQFTLAPCGLTINLDPGFVAGHAWRLTVAPVQSADTLTIGSKIYTFVTGTPNNNQIKVETTFPATALSIADSVNLIHPEVTATVAATTVTLTAKIAGTAGNRLQLSSTSVGNLVLAAFHGGTDITTTYTVRDRADQPKNAIIQLNFNESINPLTISGDSIDVADKVQIVNADGSSLPGTSPCTTDDQCKSYKCSGGSCQGDQLAGKFVVSNQYKTTEFVSDIKCGVNGCGESIYCLPSNSHLRVEVKAAALATCATNNDCTVSPYNTCDTTTHVCRDGIQNKNYPVAASINGVVDAATNSLDGNRDDDAQGQNSIWNENDTAVVNGGKGDNYQWSFWVSDRLDLTPPEMVSTTVSNNASNVGLATAIEVLFSKLMMSSSLGSGTVTIDNGLSTVTHHLINLWSMASDAVGYWVSKDDIDTPPLDGQADKTKAIIGHGIFKDSTAYRSQVGSGVKDIYQNCYKPSKDLSCVANAAMPSCCRDTSGNLVPTATLNAQGNCL